jgi:phosphatidate cytidylyltransferase
MTTTETDFGKAGRNLPAAIAVGLGLFSTLIISLFADVRFFAILVAFATVLAMRELSKTLVVGLSPRMLILLQILAPIIVVAAALDGVTGLVITFIASSLLVLSVRLLDGEEAYVHHVTRSIFALVYAPVLASFAVLLSTQTDGAWKVLAFVLLTAATDLGGYVAGAIFGKHPMAPKISPNKSWEGFAGALVLQLVVGSLLWIFVFDQSWWEGAIVGFVMMLSATLGDLIESMIKRDLGVKDMGTLLPGHGGVMDRLDSIVINAFVAWLLFGIFL